MNFKVREGADDTPRGYAKWRENLRPKTWRVTITLTKDGKYEVWEQITTLNPKTLIAMGYLPARGYFESMEHFNDKAYVKMVGFSAHDPRTQEHPNYETSSTLYDYFASKAQENFFRGLTKIRMGPLDVKKYAGIALIAIGIVFGLILLGGH